MALDFPIWFESWKWEMFDWWDLSKTWVFAAIRWSQDAFRAALDLASINPLFSDAVRNTQSYVFNANRLPLVTENGSQEHVPHDGRSGLIHFTPNTVRSDVRPKLVLPAHSGHYINLAQDTIDTILWTGIRTHALDWKSGHEIERGSETGYDAYTSSIIESYKAMYDLYGDDFDVIAICQPWPMATIAAMVCSKEHGFSPKHIIPIAAPMTPDDGPSEVSDSAQTVSWDLLKSLSVIDPKSWVRVIPGELWIMNFMSMNPEAHRKRMLELFFWNLTPDERGKIISWNISYFNISDYPLDYLLETLKRNFSEQHLRQGFWFFNGKQYTLGDDLKSTLIPVYGAKDDICPRGQVTGILDRVWELQRGEAIEVAWWHYGAFSWSKWKWTLWNILLQTDGVSVTA